MSFFHRGADHGQHVVAQYDDELIKDIWSAVNKRMALGSEIFKDEIEGLCSRQVRPDKMGRHVLQPENE